jgi:hypothetical protein
MKRPVRQDYEPLAQNLPDPLGPLDASWEASLHYYYDVQTHSSSLYRLLLAQEW